VQGGKTAILHVGNHRVAGAVVELKKPVVVVSKVPAGAAGGEEGAAGGAAAYTVDAVIRWKLLFTERPQPVITAAVAGAKGRVALGGLP
jgi:hypothetical protein